MALSEHLTLDRTIALQGATKEDAIRELVACICATTPGFEQDLVFEAVWEREKEIDTEMIAGIAFPHARLPGVGRMIIVVGFHPHGLAWATTKQEPVRLVLMLIGDRDRADEHIRVLAELARLFKQEGTLSDLFAAATPAELYERLIARQAPIPAAVDAAQQRLTASILRHAFELAREHDSSCLLLLTDEVLDVTAAAGRSKDTRFYLSTSNPPGESKYPDAFDDVFQVPFRGFSPRHRIELSLLLALTRGIIGKDDSVICVYGKPGAEGLSVIAVVHIEREFDILLSLQPERIIGNVEHGVLNRVLNLAMQLAGEGREGKPVGSMFVIGDYDIVAGHCTQIVMNPFRGYPDEERNVLDPSLEETIKEFSSIDGAFVIRRDGVVMSAGTYLQASAELDDLPLGLGTRHAAGMAITAVTDALSVVISESTGTVSLFKGGKRILALERALR